MGSNQVAHLLLALISTWSVFQALAASEKGDVVFRADPEVEKCPRTGLTKTKLNACFTQVFQRDIQPYLKSGITQLGIHSTDPITVPTVTIPLFYIGFIELKVQLEDFVLTGLSNLSRAEFDVNLRGRRFDVNLVFPRILCDSTKVTVQGHVFGRPLPSALTQVGAAVFLSMEDLSVIATATHKPTKWELVKFSVVEHGIKDFRATVKGFGSAQTDSFLNSLMTQSPIQFFRYFIRATILDILSNAYREFMEPKVWHEILKEFE